MRFVIFVESSFEMEVKPKISRNLILIVLFIVVVLSLLSYYLLSSEELTRYAITFAAEKYIPADKINVKIDKIEGCLLNGVKIDKIYIKHVKPNFEATINNFVFKPIYDGILEKGSIFLTGSIDSIESSGTFKLSPTLASVPPFLGYECLAVTPGNFKIKNFSINKISAYPSGNNDLQILSNSLELKATDNKDLLDLSSNLTVNWKGKLLAKALYKGNYEPNKAKLNGNLKLDIAKQTIVSEVSLAKGKKGMEVSGYIASDTVLDFQPLSQWLGYFWQLDYPYVLSGKLFCQGSWLYNSEVGFLGNLSGKYEKLDISVLGFFVSLLELNGNWKYFDGNLNISDTGSKLFRFPVSLDGKIEAITSINRKYNLSFIANSLILNNITSSLPWMLKYSNGIPDLEGIATFTINLSGNRPMVNAKAELANLSQISNNNSDVKVNGRAFYILPEVGSGTINANFDATSNNGLPQFFRRFNKNFYVLENKKGSKTDFKYSINGSFEENLKIKGSLKSEEKNYETLGNLIDNKLFLRLETSDNSLYNLNSVDFIDLLLMR